MTVLPYPLITKPSGELDVEAVQKNLDALALDVKPQWRGTAAPSAGSWTAGDVVWNTAPAAAGRIGWVCVTSGSPGTWKAWGPIDA